MPTAFIVMPTEVSIHVCVSGPHLKTWMPTFVGMTSNAGGPIPVSTKFL
jgi:hypothetical protein